MNLGQIRQNVYDLGYANLESQVTTAVNRVQRRVLGLRRWDFMEAQTTDSIAAGDTTIALPSDFKRVDAIELEDSSGNEVSFEYRPYQQFRGLAKWDDDQGVPQFWTEHAGTVTFWPAADDTYTATIDYVQAIPTDLSGDTDEPTVPEGYHDVLVYGAAAELAARERDMQSYAVFSGIHSTRLAEMVAEHGVRQRQNSTHVQRSAWWSSIQRNG